MPGNTPVMGLPYPLATEPVSQGDDAFESLAQAIDGLAWSNYTPGLVNWTGATTTGRFVRIGRTCHFRAKAVLTAGFTTVGGPMLQAPFAFNAAAATPQLGGLFTDASTNAYAASVAPGTSTGAALYVLGPSGAWALPTAVNPFTWGIGDSLEVFGTYEVA